MYSDKLLFWHIVFAYIIVGKNSISDKMIILNLLEAQMSIKREQDKKEKQQGNQYNINSKNFTLYLTR